MRIAIVSDRDDDIALLRRAAHSRPCTVFTPAHWRDALADDIGLLILDLPTLPSPDGAAQALLQAVQAWRAAHGQTPRAVLLLATRTCQSVLAALRGPAIDDFVVKPLRQGELALRLGLLCQAVAPGAEPDPPVLLGEFRFDRHGLHVTSLRRPALDATLTRKESDLAMLLLQHMGRPLSRAFLRERIWDGESEVPTRTVDTHISRVRGKLGLLPEHGYRLATVYGYGYQLENTRDADDRRA